ncbi:hypothetical protein PIB30_067267 [Stylosanthes scabra]|uniref:Uncharacterized protein n=1 Tax=Stylosanthes scabra TaxID=79078 RepID=A0ABU6VL33_9FABA|nr:hypothetical protein [Stylosanthes scabra]
MELVDSFNTNDNSMRTTLGRIKLDASKIGDALGLNARGNTYEKKIENKKLSDEQKAAVNSFKGVTILSLKRTIIETTVDSEENTRKFKRAFILFIQKAFLCATNSNPLSPKHFPAIVNVDNPREMNWARHVCSFLLDGIVEMKRKKSQGVEGCVFAMLIVYLHETHFGEYSEDDEARPPWISYWRGDRLKARLKLEKKDSTGLLSQAKQRKERMKKKKITDPKRVETSTKMGKKDILNSKLVKSMEMEDTTKEKRTLGKRKHHEEAESEHESENVSSDSESEDESEDISSDSESEPDSEKTISQDDNIGRKQKGTRIAVQRPQNEEANAAVRNERRSKMRHEVNDKAVQPPPSTDLNAAAIKPPHNSELDAAAGNERRSKLRHEVNVEEIQPPPNAKVNPAGAEIIANTEAAPINPLPENPAAAAPIETLPPNDAPAVAQINQLAENADAAVDPPSHGVIAIDDVLVTPQDCEIEVVEATSAEEKLISRELNESTTRLVVKTTVEKGDAAEKESVIEVVEATSAEEELIRRYLSESIANLVIETNVEKGDIAEKESVIEQVTHKYWESNREPKENVEAHKEVHEEVNRNIMMIAQMAVAQGDIGPLPSFDLGIDFGSQSLNLNLRKKRSLHTRLKSMIKMCRNRKAKKYSNIKALKSRPPRKQSKNDNV